MVRVSVIIAAYNAEATLEDCLQSVMAQEFPEQEREVILVDNNSTDRTAEIARRFPLNYVKEPEQGVAQARNRGLQEAKGEAIVFIDADCVAASGWLTGLIQPLENDAVGIVAGGVKPAEPKNLVERYIIYRHFLEQEKAVRGMHPLFPPFSLTANVAFRTEAIRRVGGFDEHFSLAGEDADLCWRIQGEGYRLAYQAGAVVWHKHRSQARQLSERAFAYGFGNAALFATHRGRWGKSTWIDIRPYVWLLKALLKLPYAWLFYREPLRRRLPYFDLLSNLGFVRGKLAGAWKHRVLVI